MVDARRPNNRVLMPRCALACVLALVTASSAAFAQPAANPPNVKIDGRMDGGAAVGSLRSSKGIP